MRLETSTLCCVVTRLGAHEKWVKRADGRKRRQGAFHSLSTVSLQAPCMRKKWTISREREREKNALLGGKFRSRSLSLLIYSAQGQHRPAAAALYLAPHRPFSATAAALFPYFPLSSPFNYLVCWLCHTTTGGPLCLFLFFFFCFSGEDLFILFLFTLSWK